MGAHTHQLLNPPQAFAHAAAGELVDAVGPHPHRQGFGFEAQSMAAGTGHQLQKLLQLLADRFTTGIAQLALEDRQDPFKGPQIGLRFAVAAVGLDRDRLLGAMQQHLVLLRRELIPGGLDLEAEGLAH